MCAILPRAMIKVLTAAVVGTIAGIVVMVVVIALSGTTTEGASESVGFPSVTVPGGSTSATVNTTGPGGSEPSGAGSGGSSSSGGGGGGGASGDASKGQALFDSKGCSGCHAIDKGQPSPVGPNLADVKLTEQQILHQIEVGGGPMPPKLATGQDAKDIAAYVLSKEQ
jgi:cytochrome c551/c552